jgi:serine/threonine protein phosphatase PrpC
MDFVRRWARRTRLGRLAASPNAGSPRPDTLIDCAFATALGTRLENQDRCAVSRDWIVLSDGAGGHVGGALAAEETVAAVVSCLCSSAEPFGTSLIEEAVWRANEAVRARRKADPAVAGMAATLTIAIATSVSDGSHGSDGSDGSHGTDESHGSDESHGTDGSDGSDGSEETVEWLVASVGDSPAWHVTAEGATQVTEADNVAGQLVKAGAITAAEALEHPGRHWITRAIGPEDRVAPQVTLVHLGRGDALVLCSDGLDVLGPEAIHEVIRTTTSSTDAADRLVDEALRNGALDNVTAAVARHLPKTCHRLEDEAAS